MNVKAIMCDVDGTLLTSEQIVSPVTVQAIRKVREQGILFGLSTGRDVASVKKLLQIWGIAGLVDIIVGTGGAEIYDFVLDRSIQAFPLEGDLIKEIISHFADMDVNFAIPHEGILFAPKDDRYIRELAEADRVDYQVVDYDVFLSEPRAKMMIICDPDYMDQVVKRAETFSNEQYKSASLITASTLYEYMDPRVSKTYGLTRALALHDLTLAELLTFGDADNDYDMTLNAGIGVAMANGSELTKSAADYITDDHNHDGIAHFINQYIL